jgi:hypothetical protein
MKNFSEAKETAAFTIGRFNPPTIGHEKVITSLVKKSGGNSVYIFPTHSQDSARNPLPHALKIAYMRKMFPKYKNNILVDKARNVFEIANTLYNKGHTSIICVVGSDRVREFETLLKKYNGVEGKKHGFYKFDSIKVISAGQRDPDADDVSGMSASKMRDAAKDGNKDLFLQGLPKGFRDGDKLYRDVRKYMGIREEREMGDMSDFEYIRDQYLTGKIWNIGDIVEANNVSGEIVRRGTNYLSFVEDNGKVHKAWLYEIEIKEKKSALQKLKDFDKSRAAVGKPPIFTDRKPPKFIRMKKKGSITTMNVPTDDIDKWEKKGYSITERNYRKEYDNYQGRPEQIARRSSRNKARRIMGDKTKIGMDVGHKDNNPLNNDPDNLRNENPSDNRREPRLRVKEKLGPNADQGDYIDDFQKSDAPQFKGKSQEKRKKMAIAAFLSKNEEIKLDEKYDSDKFFSGKGTPEQRTQLLKLQNKALRAPASSPKQKAIKKEIDALRKKMGMKVKEEVKLDELRIDPRTSSEKDIRHQIKYHEKMRDHYSGNARAKKSQNDEIKWLKNILKKRGIKEEVKLPKDDLNWVKTGGSFGKKRRFPTFVVKKEGNKYKAYDEQNKMSFKAASNSLEGLGKLLKPYIEKRTGSWKFEEVKQDKDIKDKEGTQPAKYYAGGMSKSTKDKRATHFKKKKEGPAPGDASAETKPSVHTKKFKQMYGETVLNEKITALVNKSEKSGISYSILKKVYDRGMAAYKTGHRPGTTSQQWALARVNSFITKGKGTWGKADADLAKQVEAVEEACCDDCLEETEVNGWGEITEKAEYNGKSVELNNPTKGDRKKYKVYVRNDKGNVVKVEFGDPNMEIKRDDPARRAAFRARHNCDQKKDKTTAGYWSCKFWSAKSVTDLMKG